MNPNEQRLTLDWIEEANAVISDIERFVDSIKISQDYESNCMRIFFDIETLEHRKLVICMSSRGFAICANSSNGDNSTDPTYDKPKGSRSYDPSDSDKVYETIYALLDDNSGRYRQAFALALTEKMDSIENQ